MNPYDRVRNSGCPGASPIDLLALAMARRESDVSEPSARDVLHKLGRIQALLEISPDQIREWTGLDNFELVRFQALIELGRRAGGAGKGLLHEVSSPEDISDAFDYLRLEKREHVCLVLLDSANQVMRTATIHIGTLDRSLVGMREVFREAIREGASSLILVHNHPSGDPTPSQADLDVTQQIVKIGELLEIPLRDHVILGDRGRFVSLMQRGLI
ncbi:MAG: DNA repair protein RadC [Fimbriimonadaceae bacterium]